MSGGTEFGVNAQENFDQATPALASDGGQQLLAVWANTIRADHSILSAQRYVLHDGSSLPAATDLSAGEVEVVGDEPVQRQTNPSVVAERERAAALKAQQAQNIAGTATLQVAAAPQPVDEPATSLPPSTVETVAPTPVRVPVPPTSQVVEAVPPPQPQPADPAPQATSVAATPRAQSSVPTPALPSASTAALNALGGLTQRYQAGGQARQQLGSTRSYIAPVRQYASAESSVGTSPTRSSMLLGSTFHAHDRAPCASLPRDRMLGWGNRGPQPIHSRQPVKPHPAARQARWQRPTPRKLEQKPFRPMPLRVPRRPTTRANRQFRPASYAQAAVPICDGSPNTEPVIRCNPPTIAIRGTTLAHRAPVPVGWMP